MNLLSLLEERVVKVPLEAAEKEEAICELLELLVRAGKVTDRQGVLEALYERERKDTTGIGGGIAIPHAKHPDLKGVELAIGVSRQGVEFDAVDDEPVYVVFLVVAEAHNPAPNVEVLADIGNIMQVPGVYEKLKSALSASEVIRAIQEAQQEE